ncbi:hypothetical protein BJV82DRAFT_3443 [Fennellomyces sp. T-0311]|nr:hypothetical protein BJV82DRAFT_3443 [Fennellomyces sp. T-0311]
MITRRRRRNQLSDTLVVLPLPTQDTKQMAELDSSIYSTTPIMVGTTASNNSTPRLSSQFYNNSSSRRSSGMLPNRSGFANGRSSGSFDDTSSRRLADSTFMWMVDSPDSEEDEQRRRKLGEALLAQQLQDEEGASVKYAERRPITVNDGVSGQESHAVFEER